MKKFTLILCLVLFTLTAFSYEDMLFSDRIAGRIINPQVDEILVYQISNGVLFLTNATGTPSLNVGKELLSDTEDFSGNWTLAGDFDLATLAFEYNDSAHSGTMTQANADFDDTLIASTWYLLRFTLTDASTPVAATSIVATLGTSAIAVDLDAVGTYYYLIESDAVVTGDDFVITVTTSTAGDITGTMVSLRKVDDAYDVFTNILVSNNLKVKNDLIVEGTITIENANPTYQLKDINATVGDVNASIDAQATDVGAGTEDIDVTFMAQVAGSDTDYIVFDADGELTLTATTNLALDTTGGTIESNATTISIDGAFTLDSSGNNAITIDAGTSYVRVEDMFGINAIPTTQYPIYITPSITNAVAGAGYGFYYRPTLVGADSEIQIAMSLTPAGITANATSGVVGYCGTLNIDEPAITKIGANNLTNAYTVRIGSAPNEGVNNYAFWVDSGESRFDGDIGDATNEVPTIYATDIHVSNDVLLDDGSIIGITGNEIITFDAAGTIAITGAILEIDDIRDVGNDATLSFSGTNGIDVVNALTMGTGRTDTDFTVGAAASDGIQPIFSIVGDADDDGSVTVSETLALTLTPNANPTLSTWAITSTQSSGYTWDKTISAPYYGSDGTVSNAELLFINSLGSNAQDQLDVRCLESVFGTAIGTGLTLDGTTLKGVTNLSEGTSAETTVDVNSSSGTNATLVSASTIRAGLLTKAKWDEIVVNNGKTGVTDEISNVVEDTDPDLGGDLDVGAFEILLDSTPGTTLTASGTKGVFTNGNAGNVVFGDVCYIAADGDMEFADADAAATMPGVYMALETIATTASGEWLKCGWARDDDGWNWTPGGLIYISVTGTSTNTLTQSVPTGDGDQVQIIGIATHQDRLDFNPNLMLIEINVP